SGLARVGGWPAPACPSGEQYRERRIGGSRTPPDRIPVSTGFGLLGSGPGRLWASDHNSFAATTQCSVVLVPFTYNPVFLDTICSRAGLTPLGTADRIRVPCRKKRKINQKPFW